MAAEQQCFFGEVAGGGAAGLPVGDGGGVGHLFGGGLNYDDEELTEAAARELGEEAGLTLDPGALAINPDGRYTVDPRATWNAWMVAYTARGEIGGDTSPILTPGGHAQAAA